MSDDIERTINGQFKPGQSGNLAGARARRPKKLATLEDFHAVIIKVAVTPTPFGDRGGSMTLFEANVRAMASGKPANRLASRDFVQLVKGSASYIDYLEQQRQAAAKLPRNW